MWLDNLSQEVVNRFWQQSGEMGPFPRNLERLVSLALPARLVKLPHLKLHTIESWLDRRGASVRFNCHSRAVRGCLVAYGGQGVIFIDETDSDDERRFTVAHEIGHFIVDYLLMRETAISKFGDQIAEVLDGLRPPSVTERVHAALSGTPIGIYTNLIERGGTSSGVRPEVWEIEDRADRIALALLAPPNAVLLGADITAATFEQRHESMADALRDTFGLPASAATAYANLLLREIGLGPSWAEVFRMR